MINSTFSSFNVIALNVWRMVVPVNLHDNYSTKSHEKMIVEDLRSP